MLVVETIAKIRRAHFIQGKSIKQICRELRVSRNTVRKVVRSGATEFSYDRSTQPRPKIDPWRSDLDEMLAENDRQPKRQRLTLVRIYEELRNRGYDGSYDAVRRYAASWSKATREASAAAYVPLSFDPGEAYQFDWSHEVVLIDGVTTTVKVAHGPDARLELTRRVAAFGAFNADSDPYGWHEMGVIELDGTTVWFKLDLYDVDYQYGSPEPSDPTQTRRVLTLLLPSEY